jgi:hypothetical protein
MVTRAIRALELQYLDKILDRSRSRYLLSRLRLHLKFLPTPTPIPPQPWGRGTAHCIHLTRVSAAPRLLGLRVPIPPGAWMSCLLCVVCCLCDESITRSEESYRMCVWLIVCDLETSTVRRPRPELGCCATGKEYCIHIWGTHLSE